MGRYVEGWFAGGLHRLGTEGTSGNRCAAVTKTSLRCGVCGKQAPGEDAVDQEKIAQGHPYWYATTRKVTGPIVCGQPAFIFMRAARVWAWHGFAVAVAFAAVFLILVNR